MARSDSGARRRVLSWALSILFSAALIAIDLWTKTLAEAHLKGRGIVPILGNFAVLIFTRNRGAFLSLGEGLGPAVRIALLIVLPAFAFAALGVYLVAKGIGGRREGRVGPGAAEMAALALIIAGGLGNLFDRILYGEVRDFLNFGIGRLRTGIMNLADLYILAAVVVIISASLLRPRPSARPEA